MFIPFGIGMLIIPSLIFPMLDVKLDADGLMMARTVGSMLFSFGLICFFSRNGDINTIGMRAILAGNLTFHSIDFVLTGKGAFTGVMNSLGYMFSSMHLIFAIGFFIYLLKSNTNQNEKV